MILMEGSLKLLLCILLLFNGNQSEPIITNSIDAVRHVNFASGLEQKDQSLRAIVEFEGRLKNVWAIDIDLVIVTVNINKSN